MVTARKRSSLSRYAAACHTPLPPGGLGVKLETGSTLSVRHSRQTGRPFRKFVFRVPTSFPSTRAEEEEEVEEEDLLVSTAAPHDAARSSTCGDDVPALAAPDASGARCGNSSGATCFHATCSSGNSLVAVAAAQHDAALHSWFGVSRQLSYPSTAPEVEPETPWGSVDLAAAIDSTATAGSVNDCTTRVALAPWAFVVAEDPAAKEEEPPASEALVVEEEAPTASVTAVAEEQEGAAEEQEPPASVAAATAEEDAGPAEHQQQAPAAPAAVPKVVRKGRKVAIACPHCGAAVLDDSVLKSVKRGRPNFTLNPDGRWARFPSYP